MRGAAATIFRVGKRARKPIFSRNLNGADDVLVKMFKRLWNFQFDDFLLY